ncbi:MAG: ABC transporter ATP-binding protein [Actinobacteria bacterium HGW-Actinobacteria-4]|nr:MAG: ABC transporter ATP-binding protein [Actinobacteria bacterium HGW-Actinobacteria-4]
MTALTLECQALRKDYGSDHALHGLTLSVRPGEIHAIVGLNGAGKTTLMRAITGMTSLDSGHLAVLGAANPGSDTWRRVGHMVEHPFAYPELTARENLTISTRLHGHEKHDASRLASTWLERFALDRWADRRSRELSLGNRQRLGLAAALCHHPEFVVLDEPSNALDPAGVVILRDAIVEGAAAGAGVLVSSHHLDEVARIAHSISVIHAGHVVGTLAPGGRDLEHAFFTMVHDYDAQQGGTP